MTQYRACLNHSRHDGHFAQVPQKITFDSMYVVMKERNKMEPSVSIHHFVHPAWFEALGGWTKEENIELYVNFAVEAFKRFGKHAKLWSSFNEPTVRALHA